MNDTDLIRKSLFMVGGLIVWAVQFTVIYGFNAIACARRFHEVDILGMGVVPLVVTAATVVAVLVTAAILLAAYRRIGPARDARDDKPVNDFMRYTTITIAALSLVAIVWNGVPALIVPSCG